MPKSVLVTGAFGNIGSRTVRHLLNAGHHVIAADLKNPKTEAVASAFGRSVEIAWGNICDPTLWASLLPRVDAVVHLAAIIPPVSDRKPDLATAVNQIATLELVKQMELHMRAKRLIFASSMVVAGYEQHRRAPPLMVDEEPKPTDHYGRTKVECEKRIRASTLQWSILRIAACPSTEVSLDGNDGLDAIFDTSPTGRLEVVHNDDAALAFANAVDCDQAIGRILFIGGGEKCRSEALPFYNRVFATMGVPPLKPELLRPDKEPYFYGDWLDTRESQRLLKFQRHSMDDILTEMRANFGYKRWIVKLLSPWVGSMIARRSPHRTKA